MSPTECVVCECDREASIVTSSGPVGALAPWGVGALYVPLICSTQLRFYECEAINCILCSPECF